MPSVPALGRQRQADFCEFETNLVYRATSRTGSKATEKPCLGKPREKKGSDFGRNMKLESLMIRHCAQRVLELLASHSALEEILKTI